MKYHKKHPHAKYLEQFDRDGSFVVKGKSFHPCCMCRDYTRWIEGSFQAYICSEECSDRLWQNYIEYCNSKE